MDCLLLGYGRRFPTTIQRLQKQPQIGAALAGILEKCGFGLGMGLGYFTIPQTPLTILRGSLAFQFFGVPGVHRLRQRS